MAELLLQARRENRTDLFRFRPFVRDPNVERCGSADHEHQRRKYLKRWLTALKDPSLRALWPLIVVETRPEAFFAALSEGTVSTNIYLRRLHNYALDMTWVLQPIIPRRQWPKVHFKDKRAITLEEHQRIVDREKNPERKAFYELAWHLGASQSDVANLHAEDINWSSHTTAGHEKREWRQYFQMPRKLVTRSYPVLIFSC